MNDLNGKIDAYNNTVAGKLTPAGQALVDAGLFTQAQLLALGAVAESVPQAPAGLGTGVFALGVPRTLEFGVKVSF